MKSPLVLIVEDDPMISLFIREVLEDGGYAVAPIASESPTAIQYLSEFDPDLLILDIKLEEDHTGIDVAREVRKLGKSIPFIYLSAYHNSIYREAALATQPAAYLTKPFKEADLLLAVELALSPAHPNTAATHINKSSGGLLLSDHIFIKDGRSYRKILIADLCWIKGDGSYCEIRTLQGKTVVRNVLKKFQFLVEEAGFMQVHRSYLVNLANMTSVNSKGLQFGDQVIPIKKEVRDEIIRMVRRIE